ncbi:MAG: hypothetical protein AVDCRST_MAG90-3409, partial [uncultured Microvirga sp.]
GLEEDHRHRPDRRRAAEPRQHHAGEHRLHGEEQQRAGEHGRDVHRKKQGRDADAARPQRGRPLNVHRTSLSARPAPGRCAFGGHRRRACNRIRVRLAL